MTGISARQPVLDLRGPFYFPKRPISPNEKYTSLVAAAGYLPPTLSGEDYLELLPLEWRKINAYGIRIDYRTYDSPDLTDRAHDSAAAVTLLPVQPMIMGGGWPARGRGRANVHDHVQNRMIVT